MADWADVERIYHAASARPAAERPAFLVEACGGDETLRREVESLLVHASSSAGALDGGAVGLAAGLVSAAESSVTDRRLGVYLVQERIGAGGMGEVYRARDTRLGRDVAIKILPRAFTSDPDRLARFEREARVLASLNHSNIATIHGVEEADGIRALVMELVDGETLAERIARSAGRGLPIKDALDLARQIADALDAAHGKGIVHRDLKPANIKITPDNVVKVLDFGLAKAVAGETATPDLSRLPTITLDGTRDGAILGTATYMSPEQARGRPVDKRTDIWAFGCVLYEALSGRVAFPGETISDTIAAVLEREPDWAALPAQTPEGVRQLLARCLDKDAKRRLRDMGEASIVLADTLGEIARPAAAPTAKPYGMPRKSTMLAASMLAVIAGVAGIAGYCRWIVPVAPAIRSLAVLPFENSTGDGGQDYFVDGFSDGLAAELGRLPALRVVSRAAMAKYRDAKTARSEIGREFDADAVLTGSVARVGDRVRIVTELVPTATNRPIWTETYERRLDEMFALQREVASAVASAIRIEPSEQEQRRLANRRGVNPEAYDLYLRGLSHIFRNSEEDVDRSIAFFEKSASLDSTFIPTQAYLARSYAVKSSTYQMNDPQWEEKGFAAVQRTLALDPESPEGHYAQALILWKPSHGFASREALAELRKALAVQPSFDEAWHWRGTILFHVGHLDAGIRSLERAVDLNPGHTLARFRFGPIYVYQQRFEDALAALNRVPPEAFPAQWVYQRAWALISLGRLDEAAQVVDRALRDNPTDQGGVLHSARAMTRAKRGDRKGAEADIAEAVRAGKGFVHFHHTMYSIGAVYVTLGELEKAQEWIERAANDGFPNFAFFERDVHLERLRTVPRFRAYLSQLRRDWEQIPGEPFAPSF